MTTSRNTIFEQSDKLAGLKDKKKENEAKLAAAKKDPNMDPKELKKLRAEHAQLNKEIKQTKKNIQDASKAFKENSKQAKVNEKTVDKLGKKYKGTKKDM
jgi:uncharacterized protein (DUF3084 family)